MGDSSERPEVYLGSKRDTWQDALVRIVSALILVAVIAMLAVQLAGRSTNPQETIKLVPNFKISEAGANAHPTVVVALPTVEGGAPVRFERDADGYRLYADKGVVYYGEQGSTTGHWSAWVGPARLLVTWLSVPFDGPRIHEAYVLNLDSGLMEHLPGYKVHMSAYAWQDGSLVGLLDLRNDEKHPRVLLSDLESGAVYTVYDADAKIAQWAGEDVHPKSGDFSFEHGGFTWVTRDVFVVEMSPGFSNRDKSKSDPNLWGDTLLVADIHSKSAHLLPRGFLSGGLPDGTILLSQDSTDGEDLYAIPPPYTEKPTLLSEPGVWISSVVVSHNGARVAWLETQPEPGNLARQHELCFEGCGFRPTPKAIAIWESGSGRLSRIPLSTYGWNRAGLSIYQMYLIWSRDNKSLFYHTLVDDGHVALFKLTPDYSAHLLVKSATSTINISGRDWPVGIGLVGEANDDSVYYESPQGGGPLMYRKPDGATEVLGTSEGSMFGSQQVVNSWSADGVGHVMILREKGVDVIDILTGERRSVAFQYPSEQILKGVFEPFHNVRISPDGQWVAYSGWDDNQFFSLEGMPDHGLVLKIDKAK